MKRKVLFKTAETNLLKESERKREREREIKNPIYMYVIKDSIII